MREIDGADNNIEQSQETAQLPTVVSRSDLADVHALASQLINVLHEVPEGDLVGEIVASALKLLRDQTNRGDIKLIDKSLKELRYALKVFAPYRDVRKVSIFGGAERWRATTTTGKPRLSAKRWPRQVGWSSPAPAVESWPRGTAARGANPSFGLAIRLPFEQKTNPFIDNDPKLINFKYFFTRKLMFVRSSHGIALFPGGFGTMDEGFEVLTLVQTGKSVPMPIVLIDTPGRNFWAGWQQYVANHLLARGLIGRIDLRSIKITDNIDDAVHEIRHFYSNYHSLRYARDDVVIRIHRPINDSQLAEISRQFRDIKVRGEFRMSGPLAVERDEPALSKLHRLVFNFNRREHGRLRMLIDHLNNLPISG